MKKHLFPLLTTIALFFVPAISHAQTYTPSDRKPQADNSQIGTQVSDTNNNFNIDGGLQRGQNLFHSFTDFSIPTGGAANFTNPQGNQSIITRVTGNLFSDINGLVNTNGANFLLINPNGVVFGTNAKLNVGKAFVTSTANGVDFVDTAGRNYNFGANRAGDAPLISIAPNVAFNPARLIIGGINPGSKGIENYGTLQTNNAGQYIGLIGGNITFNGGKIDAPGGRVELGGLAAPETVNLGVDGNPIFGAQFPMNVARGDISFTNGAKVNVAGSGGGDITITARNLSILSGSDVRGGIETGLGTPDAVAGDIKVNATGGISVRSNSGISNNVRLQSQGKGGNIAIETSSLSLDGGLETLRTTIQNVTAGIGDGGNIEITTGNLSVTNGAQLETRTIGKGDAGKIKIIATGNVSFDGINDDFASQASSEVSPEGPIRSGLIKTVVSKAEGKGGEIEIVAGNISVTNGARLITSTSGKGDAGKIKITSTGNVSFNGINDSFESGAGSAVLKGGEGKGGRIEIVTRNLSVTNGAQLDTSSLGTGAAGDIFLNSNTITLNKGEIISDSTSFTGGNINLVTTDYLLLRNNSLIKTDSDSTGKNNGGNITINSPLIVTLPGNNDITANANGGNGGKINITSQGLFGIQYRAKGTESSLFTNDITASSTFGQSGNVQINTPGVDPGKDTGELPAAPNDASNQIAQTCGVSQRENKFYITGRGGLPPNASEPQESEALWQNPREVKTKPATTASQPQKYAPPAIGWVFQPDGRVRLIAAQAARGSTGTKAVCPGK